MDLTAFKEMLNFESDEHDDLFNRLIETNRHVGKNIKDEGKADKLIFYTIMCDLEWLNPEEFARVKSWDVGGVSINYAGRSDGFSWCERLSKYKNQLETENNISSGVGNLKRSGLNDR